MRLEHVTPAGSPVDGGTALTLVGSLAPLAVGSLVDRSGGDLGLVPAVSAAVAGAYVVSALGFLAAAAQLDRSDTKME